MFKLARPRYVIKKYAGKKFPQKSRNKITDDDIILKYNTPKIVNKSTNITTIGSCFAQRLSEWLIKEKFNYVDGKWYRVYSPRNIKQILKLIVIILSISLIALTLTYAYNYFMPDPPLEEKFVTTRKTSTIPS